MALNDESDVDRQLTEQHQKEQYDIQQKLDDLHQTELDVQKLSFTDLQGKKYPMIGYDDLQPYQKMAVDFMKSPLGEGYQDRAGWDVNAHRLGHGSDQITKEDGTVVKVRPGMSTTPKEAMRDLVRRVNYEFSGRARSNVGREIWKKLPDPAKAMLVSIAYQSGSVPAVIRRAAATLDMKTLANVIGDYGTRKFRRGNEKNFLVRHINKPLKKYK